MYYLMKTVDTTITIYPKLIKLELQVDNLNNVIYKDIKNLDDYYIYITSFNTTKKVILETTISFQEYRVLIDRIHTGVIVENYNDDTYTNLLWRLYIATTNVEVINYEKTQENSMFFNVRLKITGYFAGGFNV